MMLLILVGGVQRWRQPHRQVQAQHQLQQLQLVQALVPHRHQVQVVQQVRVQLFKSLKKGPNGHSVI